MRVSVINPNPFELLRNIVKDTTNMVDTIPLVWPIHPWWVNFLVT